MPFSSKYHPKKRRKIREWHGIYNSKYHLFSRHEIAFVFGQLLSPHSVPALLRVLQDGSEQEMVLHEAAEALGGIATPEVLPHLKEWMSRTDAPRVVRESCMIALDMWEVCLHFSPSLSLWRPVISFVNFHI